jgi:HAD superfamily hydrolase (TIGR01484 family)
MQPLANLPSAAALSLRGIVFDLDDTFLDHGQLTEQAYASLFRLREAGLLLIACTGRPAGWVDLMMRQWPIDAGVAENGAIRFARRGAEVVRIDSVSPDVRKARRERLSRVADALHEELPGLTRTDDDWARVSDVTFDIGEHVKVPAADVDRLVKKSFHLGTRSFVSSIHFHITLDAADKASGGIAACRALGVDPTVARSRFAFIGDSGNDAAAFAGFDWTFGVANVAPFVPRLSIPPRFVASKERGAGFSEIADKLLELRRSRP